MDPYEYDMLSGEEPEPITGNYEIPKAVLEAKPKKNIPWAMIGIAVGAVAVVAVVVVVLVNVIGNAGSRGGSGGDVKASGTALTDMLNDAGDELADIYDIDE